VTDRPESPSPNAAQSVAALLEPGERLLWHGRPEVNRLIRRQYGWCFLMGAFGGLSLLWAGYAIRYGTAVSLFVATLFVLLGVGAVAAKAREILSARRIHYAVTDRRALVATLGRAPDCRAFGPSEIGPIETANLKDGVGDVLFHQRERFMELRGRDVVREGFPAIADTEGARAALKRLMDGALVS
jgi:hypothetical protein